MLVIIKNGFNFGLVLIPMRNIKLFFVGQSQNFFYKHFLQVINILVVWSALTCAHTAANFQVGYVISWLSYNSWLFLTDKYQRTQQGTLLTHFNSHLENEVTSWPIYRLGMCANRLPTSISFTSPCQVISAWGRRSEIGAAYCAIYFPSFLLDFPHFLSV